MTKMSDVFDLPLYIGYDDAIYGNDKIEVGEFIQCQQDEAAVLAINAYPAMLEALERIVSWSSFPEATLSNGEKCSYGVAYGSNGERDYMRRIAADALAFAKGKA